MNTEHKDDEIRTLRTELKQEIRALRTELKDEIRGLRSELKDDNRALRTELKGQVTEVRTEVRTLRGHITDMATQQMMVLGTACLWVVAIVCAVVAAAAR